MSHLTIAQRYTIASMREAGYNQPTIAKAIGKSNTIYASMVMSRLTKCACILIYKHLFINSFEH